jgi:hypothetical protein
MGLTTDRISTSNVLSTNITETSQSDIGVVFDVITDENNEYLKKYDEGYRLTFIGAIIYRTLDAFGVSKDDIPIALPVDATKKDLPTINERVHIIKTGLGIFYKRMQPTNETPNSSAAINEISLKIHPKQNSTQSAPNLQSYKETATTGITNNDNTGEFKKYDKFGKYFKFTPNIHKLKLYEGDSIIESRFGQSIRFSAYNNKAGSTPSFSPTIIIRNGESPFNQAKNVNITIEEDVNMDGSTIALSSKDYELPFIPGTLDKNGKSDFETKPESFVDYPVKLNGDQILLSSGRLMFSARNGEMIFYSKKNYGFISDGNLSIDNKLGIDISVKDNINIVTNDKDVVMVTGNGKIFLGNKDLEPVVKGKQLVSLLGELIDLIGDMQFKTPAGPSAIGSENRKAFGAIKDKLNNILSNQNQTS